MMRGKASPSKPARPKDETRQVIVKKRSEPAHGDSVSPLKRQRCKSSSDKGIGEEPSGKNPWEDVPDDVLLHIMWLCTRDPDEILGLEASCRNLHHAVLRCWKILARDYYNITDHENGKDAWKEGRALNALDPSRCEYVYFRNADYGVFRDGVFFGCNESIMIMSSSGHDTLQDSSGFVPENPIRIRDAATLKIVANMEGSANHKAVDLLGPSGNEFIVEYLDQGLRAHRNNRQVWEHTWSDGPTTTDQWCMLPSHHALLMIRNRNLHLFVYTPDAPKLTDVVKIETQNETPTMNWENLGRNFVLHVHPGILSFWKIDKSNKMRHYKTTTLSVKKSFDFIYSGSKHLVATGATRESNNDVFDDNIYVFDTNGMVLHKLLENIVRPRPNHHFSPMNAVNVINSELLVSNSLMGAALCVWNLRTGKLVHRQEQAIAEGHMFRPGEEYADGTWIHCLDQLPSFDFPLYVMADTGGSLFVWGFPDTAEQRARIAHLKELAENENTR